MPSNAAYTPPHPLANGGTGGAQNVFLATGPNGSHDDVAARQYDKAVGALARMHDAYTAIGFKRPDCRLSREGGQSCWHAYCCGTTGFGYTPRQAARDVARVWSQAMQNASWVNALVKHGATPDQIRDLAEAISAAIDATSEDSP